ncbi:MAG: hypothetical protein KJN64_10890 [Ignavibacteria bacterium]|nr:hypothetical protein [Ignavibacteria bacterium]MBT8382420.1 hypothetical protein [Ignavibacteria bacterium]NNJ52773.1 hypothetical protein [Ignavibacteriaceae bacterium]NNL20355.1 hypothetical protein [Ignavibacteriaceae bacterium]
MNKSVWLWIIAFILTVFTAAYQRITGPTYPLSGNVKLDEQIIEYKLDRTHGGEGDHQIEIRAMDKSICGELYWKRFKTNDEWTSFEMERKDEKLIFYLPHQPPAGKLLYKIILQKDDEVVKLPEEGEIVIRFKGAVPIFILIPHIIFIFAAMLLSARTGLEYFNKKKFKTLTILTVIFLIIGGFILGPIVQKYAFGEFWTGFPFGHDLTDNKVLIAFIFWFAALIAVFKSKRPVKFVIIASVVTFIIFLIPHSLLGSELDYSELDKNKIELNTE